MAEEKIHNVNVVLHYAVTGNESAAKDELANLFQYPQLLEVRGIGYKARFICSDVETEDKS